MEYISSTEMYHINAEITGHKPIVRDQRLLQAAMRRPFVRMFGAEAYPTFMEKAAALLHSVAHDHIFADGNKRTACEVVTRFLHRNGYTVDWTDCYDFILRIAQGQVEIPEIAAWLEDRTAPHNP